MAEALVSLLIIGIVSAAAMPMMTQMSQMVTNVDKNTMKCIAANDSSTWYTESDGITSVPAYGTDPICYAAVLDTQHNRGRAFETAKWHANHGTVEQKIMAKKILRAACDQGGSAACGYFIDECWKSGSGSEPYCDDTNNFLDLTYYLHQYTNITPGGQYIKDQLEGIIPKNVTNLVNEINYACINNQTPDYSQNLGDNIACKLLGLSIAWWIQQCNDGSASACEYSYDNNYNHSCYQIKSVWSGATTGVYTLTANGDPGAPTNEPTIDVNCNMTSLASAAISGCGYGAVMPHVTGDCTTGYDNAYNQSCNQVKTAWDAAPTGNFELTHNGAGSPATVYCNTSTIASAAITGCGYDASTPLTSYVPGDCTYGKTNTYNQTCDEILAAWPARPEGYYYNLTGNAAVPPDPGSSTCRGAEPPDPACGVTTIGSIKVSNCNIAKDPVANGTDPGGTEKCWYGKGVSCYAEPYDIHPSGGCGTNTGGGNYDKYLCNHAGAVAACHALNGASPEQYGDGCDTGECSPSSTGWRLPTNTELATFYPAGGNPLELCDRSSSYSPYCGYYSGCSGSASGGCYPNRVWSAEPGGSGFYCYYLASGSWYGPNSNYATYAFSVRCVRSL